MADTKISALSAVAASAATDEFAVNQGGTSKKATLAQMLTNDAHAGYQDWAAIADPSAPAASTLRVYSKNVSGRIVPKWVGPSGLDTMFQASLAANNVVMWLPGTGTVVAINFGVSWTVGATQAHPTIASTSKMTSIKRATYTCSTSTSNASGVRSSAPVVLRGSASGVGGFFFAARFGILTYASNMRVWCGLSALSTLLAGDPSSQNDTVCMSKDTGETVWQVLTRDTTAASKTSTGRTTAAAGNTNIFDFYAFCKPNDTHIYVRVVDTDGTVLVDNVDKTSNLPTNTTPLYAHCEAMNNGTGSTAIFLNKIYIESDN